MKVDGERTVDSKRAIVLVLDGCGAGAAPDAALFGDPPTVSTVLNVWRAVGGFHAPNLRACGFLAACGVGESPEPVFEGRGVGWGRLRELSMGKDSVTGHWELMGIVTETPFPLYPDGFPEDLVAEFERRIGARTLGNVAISGTQIIDQLGGEHMQTGYPILYTSGDSVLQLACHESVVPIGRLYEICRIARELCVKPHDVQRVIARPFEGEPGAFRRTERRKDFPAPAPPNLVDEIGDVYGIGVVPELFGGRGFRDVPRTQSNAEHEKVLFAALESDARFIFANFEDFDMLYGHRNDVKGFAECLERFDQTLRRLLDHLREDDLLILTSDHGNDPTNTQSTDHTREYVPVSVMSKDAKGGGVGDIEGMMAVGATVAAFLGVKWEVGQSLL
jgi:phosphopentomutase